MAGWEEGAPAPFAAMGYLLFDSNKDENRIFVYTTTLQFSNVNRVPVPSKAVYSRFLPVPHR
jgi:hypothetical protein